MPHFPVHLLIGAAALVFTIGLSSGTANRLLRKRLRLSMLLLAAYVALNLLLVTPGVSAEVDQKAASIEQLLIALAVVNASVALAANPFRADRVPERFPAIVQDAVTIGVFLVVATFVFQEKLLTTSAVGAVVVGFALQDTLGNMFAGLAIQVEKPFRVGHWITVGGFEGRVDEVTWRATKLRTKSGNIVVVPNSTISKEAITNYSEPEAPTRIQVDVSASYDATPNEVKQAIHTALLDCPLVLRAPAADVLLLDFASSAVTYRVRFWIRDYQQDEQARDQVRTSVYYVFRRRAIEIPYPMQVQYARDERPSRTEERTAQLERLVGGIDLLAGLSDEERVSLVTGSEERIFGDGQTIVQQGDIGRSMFIVCSGSVRVVVEPSGAEVARLKAGDYFGEMTLLTGEPRTATVRASGDCLVLEITADAIRPIVVANPRMLDQLSVIVSSRLAGLEEARTSAQAMAVSPREPSRTLLARIQQFLGL